MATFKIKLEDKAAFLNRLEKAGVALDTNQAKDNKLKGYFEVTSDNLEQIEQIKTILKQSPKINTIKEMKTQTRLTRNDLREMVRKELRNVLKEEKEKKGKKEKEQLDEFFNPLDPIWAPLYTALMFGGISLATWLQRISREKGERKEFLVQKMKDAADRGVEFDQEAFDKEWGEKMATRREKEAERSKGALGRANIMVSKGGDDRFF